MSRDNPHSIKKQMRKELLARRNALGSARREEAANALLEKLYPLLAPYARILSFSSFPQEINLLRLNTLLESEGRLFIPETIPSEALASVDCILVPALGYDSSRMRIGYGRGYYDRLLANTQAHTIGVAFKEQFVEGELPREPHDQRVDALLLF